MAELTADQTGQSVERITRDADRDRWFTAEEARVYGFIDQVVARQSPNGSAAARPQLTENQISE